MRIKIISKSSDILSGEISFTKLIWISGWQNSTTRDLCGTWVICCNL